MSWVILRQEPAVSLCPGAASARAANFR